MIVTIKHKPQKYLEKFQCLNNINIEDNNGCIVRTFKIVIQQVNANKKGCYLFTYF